MPTERGRYLAELRRSGAAGVHSSRATRTEQNREAIKMSMLDLDYPDDSPVNDDRTPESIDHEDYSSLEEESGLYGDDMYVYFPADASAYDGYDLVYEIEYDRP